MATKHVDLSSSTHFNVFVFFHADVYEQVRTSVPAREAFDAFIHYTSSVSARMGMTERVIITDMNDDVNAEWILGQGITFPTAGQIEAMRIQMAACG